jgi:hypothetical protein
MTLAQLIEDFGGPAEFARAIGLNGASTAGQMKRVGRIDVRYWPGLIKAGERRGIAIDADMLMRMCARVDPGKARRAS